MNFKFVEIVSKSDLNGSLSSRRRKLVDSRTLLARSNADNGHAITHIDAHRQAANAAVTETERKAA